jgi:hypothetical protein
MAIKNTYVARPLGIQGEVRRELQVDFFWYTSFPWGYSPEPPTHYASDLIYQGGIPLIPKGLELNLEKE